MTTALMLMLLIGPPIIGVYIGKKMHSKKWIIIVGARQCVRAMSEHIVGEKTIG